MVFKVIFLIITILNVSLANEIEPLFENCEHIKDSESNYKNIIVNIFCHGQESNVTDQFPERLAKAHYQYRIKQLKITSFNFSTIPNDIFNKLIIEKLDLKNNQIEHVDPKSFSGIIGLDYLDLSENSITTLHENIFSSLNQMTTLLLNKNRISKIETNAFSNLTSIKTLDLSYNQIKDLESALLESFSKSLETLILSSNSLETFPKLNLMKEINYLDLSNNLIALIQESTVPDKLKALTLTNNKLCRIKREAFNTNMGLIFLDLSNNSISEIEKNSFENLINLRILRLGYNKLSSIPDLGHLISLAELDLSNQASNLSHIQSFALDRDDLPLSGLNRLDLSNNKIESFDKRAFCSNTGPVDIEYLILDNNPIKNFDPCVFNQLKPSRMTIFYNTNNSTNCNCNVVNYLSSLNINLFSDCDLNEMTKCSRSKTFESDICSDLSDYSCEQIESNSVKINFNKFLLALNFLFLLFFSFRSF